MIAYFVVNDRELQGYVALLARDDCGSFAIYQWSNVFMPKEFSHLAELAVLLRNPLVFSDQICPLRAVD